MHIQTQIIYNGLNWRITKEADTNPGTDTDLDQKRIMYYSANWQLLEERVDDDQENQAGETRRFEYVWGLRYIDDLIMRHLFTDPLGTPVASTYYHCTDAQYSTVSVLDSAAHVLERVYYNEYGRARACPPEDMTGD